jgi:phosphoribosylanthranilate isomerase
MRELLAGELDWEALPSVSRLAQSFQFNIAGTTLPQSPTGFLKLLGRHKALRTFIFQITAASEPLVRLAHSQDFNVMGLFDNSGGRGISPETAWPSPLDIPFPMGFAGGLGPDNVLEQLDKINAACGDKPYATWIDMEGRIRTDDGTRLDLTRVRRVLEQVAGSRFISGPSSRK